MDSTITNLESIISLLHILSKSLFITTSPLVMHDGKTKQETATMDDKTGCKLTEDDKKHAGSKLPEGTKTLFFTICMRVMDYFKPL